MRYARVDRRYSTEVGIPGFGRNDALPMTTCPTTFGSAPNLLRAALTAVVASSDRGRSLKDPTESAYGCSGASHHDYVSLQHGLDSLSQKCFINTISARTTGSPTQPTGRSDY